MNFTIHCLDVGNFNFGDSILCKFGTKTILIDGGQPGSKGPTDSVVLGEDVHHTPIQDQMRQLLNQSGPVTVDLLIVTHCHKDHMGCLPDLVTAGDLKCRWALLADPRLGYGITADSDEPPTAAEMTARDKLWLALREEPLFGGSDEEIAAFIEDSAEEYEKYVKFVNRLKDDLGTKCVEYRGLTDADSPGLSALLAEFSSTGMKIYGPTFDQLATCALRLVGRSDELIEDATADGPGSLVEAYRNALDIFSSLDADGGEDGAAVNCQSLVLRFGSDAQKVLLTADMQFQFPDVGDATPHVKALLEKVNGDAPFTWVKLSHHGATNGQSKAILTTWGAKLLTVSTGSHSSKHPTEPTLKALEELEPEGFKWSRVDMNGRCTFTAKNGTARLTKQRGILNDKTRPSERTGDVVPVAAAGPAATPPAVIAPATPAIVVAGSGDEHVDIQIRVPHRRTRVAFTIDVDPGGGSGPFVESTIRAVQSADAAARRLGGGRALPRLLFVTSAAALAGKIGPANANATVQAITGAGQPLVNDEPARLLAETRRTIDRDRAIKGVVLVGGYDVVPSQILNTLPRELAQLQVRDRDRLQVWSDDGYGDREGDGVPELPVSRVPDGGSNDFLWSALASAGTKAVRERSGIRNIRRPFAESVFGQLPGRSPLFTSQPTAPNLPPFALAGDVLYLMLHGTASDTAAFTGEDDAGGYPVALSATGVPQPCPGVVFAGCCYGALIVEARARDAQPGTVSRSRGVSESVALTCLARGANAFVGCTGVHYSPLQPPLTYFGQPMHRAFVDNVLGGKAPAEALWRAKVAYGNGIPHRLGARPEEIAYEHKILCQFTCLGLGW
jgi:beta-lactamase superfamily II metal-dependent hydrolase